jgi:hypothetical protein
MALESKAKNIAFFFFYSLRRFSYFSLGERERGVSSSLRQRVAERERERTGSVGLLIKFKLELCFHFGLGLVTVKNFKFCFTVGMTWTSGGV